jgi:microcystin degradation protein MlrC
MYCRPVFVPIAKSVIECDSEGVTSSRYEMFPFRNVSRPVYPLDKETPGRRRQVDLTGEGRMAGLMRLT